jgi:hypothetical protein
VKFTVNLSVISRARWVEQSSAEPFLPAKPAPSTFYGPWGDHVRIGILMPSGQDLWWWLNRGENPIRLADEVVSLLLDLAVPWLLAKSST